ncbi:MAG: PilZ domain-containing protein [Desulfuromonadales bacterium]
MDFTSLYTTHVKSSFDDDQAEILKIFNDNLLSKEDLKVTIINYFKELPIVYPATVVAVERGSLDLDINPQQAVAIASDRYTLIRSKLFTHEIAGHVQYVNIKKHAVTLNKLCYVEVLADKRTAVRLGLDPPVQATICCGDQKFSGELLDISVQGLAISIVNFLDLESGTEVSVEFILLDPVLLNQTPVTISARLVAVEGDSSPYRCKFRIAPDKHQEQLIARFSFQRQVEIIRSLKVIAGS